MDWKSSLNTVLMGIIAIALTVIAYMTFVQKTTLVPSDAISTQTAPMAKTPEVKTPITQDETVDWKVYTNAKYGFEFRYPQFIGFIDVQEEVAGQGVNVRFYVKTTSKKWGTGDGKYDILTVAIQPKEAVISEYTSRGVVFDTRNVGEKDGKYYILSRAQEAPEDFQHSIFPFEGIKSTFKLTNQISDLATADWKTYTNNSLGFSIKYPSDWKIDSARSDRTMSGSDVVFNVGIPESHEGITVNTSNVSSLDEWVEQAKKNLVLDGAYQGTSYLTVDGQPAVRIDTTEFGGKIVAVLFNGKLYRFDTQGQMIENGMLSTFKFIQ